MKNKELENLLVKLLGERKEHRLNPIGWIKWIFGVASLIGGSLAIVAVVAILFLAASAIPSIGLNFAYALGVYKASRVQDGVTGGRPELKFNEAKTEGQEDFKKELQKNPNLNSKVAVNNGVTQEEYDRMKRDMEARIEKERGSAAAMAANYEQAKLGAENLDKRLKESEKDNEELREQRRTRDLQQLGERTYALRMAQSALINDMKTPAGRACAQESILHMVWLLEWFVTVRSDHPGWNQIPDGRDKDNRAYLKDLIRNLRDAEWFFDRSKFQNALVGHLLFSQKQVSDLLSRVHGENSMESRLRAAGLWN